MTNQNEKVRLTKDKETYLSTLYGKALDSRVENPILGDTFADEVVQRIDFDFEKLHLASGGSVSLPMRAKHLDGWTREFLAANPESTVLHLGCGLDSRVFRIDPLASVRWYDVDLPDVIELRKQLYPERHDYAMIATSVTDPHWLEGIPGDRPVLVVAEGLVMYLHEQDGVALFSRITGQFPSGQIIFDAYSRLTVGLLNLAVKLSSLRSKPTAAGSSVFLPWGINDPHALEREVPRLKLVTATPFLTLPELIERMSSSPAQMKMGQMLGKMGWYRRSMLHIRYAF
jgi:O-methyltransferase involved in polyketide biosynthesis